MTKPVGIAGAGLSGAVVARELAEKGDLRVEVFEQRSHVAGHCYTERDPATGVLLHLYGAHVFHTDDVDVWRYVNRFDEFVPYTVRVKAVTGRGVFSLPINLLTLNQFFGVAMNPREAQRFLETLGDPSVSNPQSFEEQALRFVGRDLYEAFFLHYTRKQWGVEPRHLPSSIMKRLPIRVNYDDAYFNDRYQGIPRSGYTDLVHRILDHDRIRVHLGESVQPGSQDAFSHLFYSGSLDGWFEHRLGRLRYRSLFFERVDEIGDYQGAPLITYCEASVPWTRILEHKHLSPWEDHGRTVVFREYSRATTPSDTPFYPLRLVHDEAILSEYVNLARGERGVTFIGRLGTYRYLDMHVVIREALDVAERYLKCRGREPFPPFSHPPLEVPSAPK
jgi:UDP-galactopyranose mutase